MLALFTIVWKQELVLKIIVTGHALAEYVTLSPFISVISIPAHTAKHAYFGKLHSYR